MSDAPKDGNIPEFLTYFETIPDPRQAAKAIYPLDGILNEGRFRGRLGGGFGPR